MDLIQSILLGLATTIDVWRDGAIMLLAGIVIAAVWFAVEGAR